jgi:hypothetical protein
MIKTFMESEKQVRRFFIACMVLLLIGSGCVVLAVFSLATQQKKDREQLHEADVQLLEYAEQSKKRWDALGDANPELSVPQIVESTPDTAGHNGAIIVIPAKRTATPTPMPAPVPSATPAPKTARPAVAPYHRAKTRPRPTATPWFNLFKTTR